ncbi:hypothetical protein F01_260284 [Burkholderia cenocepacia]|nr:hypothetical protein F01_260284 [Burkholderia cenocepacia]
MFRLLPRPRRPLSIVKRLPVCWRQSDGSQNRYSVAGRAARARPLAALRRSALARAPVPANRAGAGASRAFPARRALRAALHAVALGGRDRVVGRSGEVSRAAAGGERS